MIEDAYLDHRQMVFNRDKNYYQLLGCAKKLARRMRQKIDSYKPIDSQGLQSKYEASAQIF
jgi:hypothetical protein